MHNTKTTTGVFENRKPVPHPASQPKTPASRSLVIINSTAMSRKRSRKDGAGTQRWDTLPWKAIEPPLEVRIDRTHNPQRQSLSSVQTTDDQTIRTTGDGWMSHVAERTRERAREREIESRYADLRMWPAKRFRETAVVSAQEMTVIGGSPLNACNLVHSSKCTTAVGGGQQRALPHCSSQVHPPLASPTGSFFYLYLLRRALLCV